MLTFWLLLIALVSTLTTTTTTTSYATIKEDQERECLAKENTYFCQANSECISALKVCNFVWDCINGQDELACGACEFTPTHSQDCALNFDTSGESVFEWVLSEFGPEVGEEIEHNGGDYANSTWRKPRGSVRLEPSELALHSLRNTGSAQSKQNLRLLSSVHRAQIVLPPLRPTDSSQCAFTFWVHSRLNLHPNQARTSGNDSIEFPSVRLVAINGKSMDNNELQVLDEFTLGHTSDWVQMHRFVAHRFDYAFWSLALQVDTKFQSNLLSFGSFKFQNCQAENVTQVERKFAEPIPRSILATGSCPEFQCRLTGRCIGHERVCDYGRDCGQFDLSDELECAGDQYEGRCDFEQADECQWKPMASGEWLWSSVRDVARCKPQVDHTLQSQHAGGHYMLVAGRASYTPILVGPRVWLKAGESQCNFRFWMATGGGGGGSNSAAYLRIGYQQVHGLFERPVNESAGDENGWRRFQVNLFDNHIWNQDARIESLHITLNNYTTINSNSTYLALDDFSFSSGCQLAHYNTDPQSLCSSDQFECSLPAPRATPTSALCIPRARVCDFKADCGLHPKTQQASDELECAPDCQLSGSKDCGISLEVANFSDDLLDSKEQQLIFNQAIDVTQSLEFTANYERFQEIKQKNATNRLDIWEARARLPTFSQAHANCTLELVYQWTKGTHNLQASVYLMHDLSSVQRSCTIIKSDHQQPEGRRRFGIGEQQQKFTIHLQVEPSLRRMAFSGSLIVQSYTFHQCAYEPGLLDTSQEAEVLDVAEVHDDEDDLEQILEHEEHKDNRTQAPDRTCKEGQFQCTKPVLCISESLVCDNQRDCQESGADELNCTNERGFFKYDFEDRTGPFASWKHDNSHSTTATWSVRGVDEFVRRTLGIGPPVDHTHAFTNQPGKFLEIVHTATEIVDPSTSGSEASLAIAYTPRFKRAINCTRLVFYLYHWLDDSQPPPGNDDDDDDDDDDVTLKVMLIQSVPGEHKPSESLLWQLSESKQQVDWWQRVQLQLPPPTITNNNNNNNNSYVGGFRIAFWGRIGNYAGRSTALALDDVILGPQCERQVYLGDDDLALSPYDIPDHIPDENPIRKSWLSWPILLIINILILSAICIGISLYRRRRNNNSANASDLQGVQTEFALNSIHN